MRIVLSKPLAHYDLDPKSLNARCEIARSTKNRWINRYADLYKYVIPTQNAFSILWNYNDAGMPITQWMYDDTAYVCACLYANDIKSLLIPADRVWGRFSYDKEYETKIFGGKYGSGDALQSFLDKLNKRIMSHINKSNFYRAASSAFLDFVGGTGCIAVKITGNPITLDCRTIPAICVFPENTTDDTVGTCWYQVKMTGREILYEWPNYAGDLRSQVDQDKDKQFSVVYGQVKLEDNVYFKYAIIKEDPDYFLYKEFSTTKTFIVFRDRVRPGESEGTGVGLTMINTIRDLNLVMRAFINTTRMKGIPSFFFDTNSNFSPQSFGGDIAGAWIPRSPMGRNPVEALNIPEFPDNLQFMMDARDRIRNAFNVDPIGSMNDPTKSASEIHIRDERSKRRSVSDSDRVINEGPKAFFIEFAKLLNKAGLLTDDEKVIEDFNIDILNFEFSSPLLDVQKDDNISRLAACLQFQQQYLGEGTALVASNLGRVVDYAREQFNLPVDLFKTQVQIEQSLLNMKQAAQQAALPAPTTQASQTQLPSPERLVA